MNRNYFCSDCNLSTLNPRLYLEHRRDIHGDSLTIHECDLCIYATKHSAKLARHRRTVHRGIVSSNLSSIFYTNDNDSPNESSRNEIITNESSRMYSCSKCTFFSINKILLIDHFRVAHPDVPIYECNTCNYSHFLKDRFNRHQRYHTQHRVHCSICEFQTIYKWNMDRHMRHHVDNNSNNITGFQCNQCNFTATTKQSITSHKINHHRLNETKSNLAAFETNRTNELMPNCEQQSMQTTNDANDFHPLKFLELVWQANLKNVLSNEPIATVHQPEIKTQQSKVFYCQNCYFRNEIIVSHEIDVMKPMNETQNILYENQQQGYRCGYCHQLSNWKHVIERHCRLIHKTVPLVDRFCATKKEYERISTQQTHTENAEQNNHLSVDIKSEIQ